MPQIVPDNQARISATGTTASPIAVTFLVSLALLAYDTTMDVRNAFINYSLHALFASLVALALMQRKLS